MPTLHSHTDLQAAQTDTQAKACKRECLPNHTRTLQTRHYSTSTERRAACNSGFKKLAVLWLNQVQFLNQTVVQVDSFMLRNRQLLKPAKRQVVKLPPISFKNF